MATFATPRGTQDILPKDWRYFNFIVDIAEDVARLFGYRRIETPIFGQTSLFARTSGEGTDIVDKEMYVFQDRDGESLALRPEGTAPVMRAYHEYGMSRLPQPVKLYYVERMYRYDKPQRGRFREHRQFGCEAIGLDDAFIDAEMISLLDTFYRRIGLEDLSLHVNSIGDARCRPVYLQKLVGYLHEHVTELAPQDRDRVARNPLRVLDSKEPLSQPAIAQAPHMLDFLCDDCAAHWRRLLHALEVLGIHAEVDHRLVRGLDYYTRTVFEFLPSKEGAQAVVGGGGRYDALSEAMGGPHVPGIGFGTGIERLVLNLQERGVVVPPEPRAISFVAHFGPETDDQALRTAQCLRSAGISTDMAFGGRAPRTQMKNASAAHARVAIILGEDEIRQGTATLRSLESGQQESVSLEQLPAEVKRLSGE